MRPISAVVLAAVIQLWLVSISFANSTLNFSEAYWVDESRGASLLEARQATFSAFKGSLGLGYVPHALWIKLTIEGQSDGKDLAVVVRPAFLRHIELYDPEVHGTTAPPVVSGRDAAIEDGNHVAFDNGFIIPSSAETRDVYLRIITTTSLTADIMVLPLHEAIHDSFVLGGFISVYFAFLLGFFLWSVVAWGLRGDVLYGLFAFRQLYSLAHIFVFFGSLRFYLSESLSAEGKELLYAVVSCTVGAVVGYFDVRLISEFGGSRWLRRAIYVLLCLPIVTLTLIASDQVQMALKIGAMGVLLQMFALVAYAFTTKVDSTRPYGSTSIYLVRIGYVIMMVVVVVPLLMYQNLLHSSVPAFKILFLHAVISTIILFTILSIRSRRRDLMAQQAQLMAEVKEVELRQESRKRKEKERFLSMLTHELRNPLSVIELLSGTDPSNAKMVRKAARDMAEVIARVEQSERIDSGKLKVEKTEFDLSALVHRIAAHHTAHERLAINCASSQVVNSDEGLLHRIVENLLDNAAKYGVPGSEIRVALNPFVMDGQEGVQLTVANQIGTAGAPDPERLFSKYYRAKGARRQPGSGLGLYLVASWVDALGGAVTYSCDSPPGGAPEAIFKIWMPR